MATGNTVSPTQFDELNRVLTDLTERATDILGASMVGAYLQGSFALGDADIHSDCDFLILVRERITAEQEAALRALHDELPTQVPPDVLRRRMRADIHTFLEQMQTWISLDIAWAQRYAVSTLCRLLFTLDTGRVCRPSGRRCCGHVTPWTPRGGRWSSRSSATVRWASI